MPNPFKTIAIFAFIVVGFFVDCSSNTHEDKFIISIDTLNINLKPFVSPDNVNLTHAIKYGDNYYCFFTDKKDDYRKYFFSISLKGAIEKEINLRA